ncbi:hypothetical protein DFJ58DRAFT_913189, partial [Suillus subalutaceus]|uniref:uncharacterized protein n=1 Tax=Suillus subalutaceus TaxID=48586 RepID=UPI001B86E79F
MLTMTEDHRPKPPPEPSASREATAGESLSQLRSGFRQAVRKFKKNATKKISKHFERSHQQTPTGQNADREGASSNQNIEDASRLHPSDIDGDKPATSENLSDSANQGAPGEPASKVFDAPSGVEEIPDTQSVDAELRGARERMKNMRLLGGHATSVASAAKDGPKDLDAADNFQTTYLQPLRIFDTVIRDLANVHPYAKVVLGMLSAASK